MSITKKNKQNIGWEIGTENIFADLGMFDADEKLAKAELALKINQILNKKGLKQIEAAKLLGIDQSKISLLNRGRLSEFSIDRLVKFLTLLHQDVDIVIKKSKKLSTRGRLHVVYA